MLYFRGCVAREKLGRISKATEEILKSAGIEYRILENEECCGSFLLRTGFREDAEKVMKKTLKEIEGEKILTACAGCYKTFKKDYKGRKDVINYAGETVNFYTSRGKRLGRFERDEGQHDEIRENDKIDGSCMLIKREVIEKVRMFDPIYFAYWEEADLCVRIKNAGYKLVYIPKARIWHKIGVSWDTYFSYFIIYHFLVRNRLIFIWRYASTFQKIVFSGFFIIYLLFNMVLMLIKEDLNTSKDGLGAIKDGIMDFRKCLKSNKI